jgi:hypothetical protein
MFFSRIFQQVLYHFRTEKIKPKIGDTMGSITSQPSKPKARTNMPLEIKLLNRYF